MIRSFNSYRHYPGSKSSPSTPSSINSGSAPIRLAITGRLLRKRFKHGQPERLVPLRRQHRRQAVTDQRFKVVAVGEPDQLDVARALGS